MDMTFIVCLGFIQFTKQFLKNIYSYVQSFGAAHTYPELWPCLKNWKISNWVYILQQQAAGPGWQGPSGQRELSSQLQSSPNAFTHDPPGPEKHLNQ